MRTELLVTFRGRVQGVGFRATAQVLAQRLKLTGYVRNLSDGGVELCAQGEKAQLEELLTGLKREFSSECVAEYRQLSKTYSDFKIVR